MTWLEKEQRMLGIVGQVEPPSERAESPTLSFLENPSKVNPDPLQCLTLRFMDADRPSQYQWNLRP